MYSTVLLVPGAVKLTELEVTGLPLPKMADLVVGEPIAGGRLADRGDAGWPAIAGSPIRRSRRGWWWAT